MSHWSSSLPAFKANVYETGSDSRAVVFVWAAWDPICHVIDVSLKQAQSDYPRMNFYAMNLDDPQNWPVAQAWGVLDTRTLVCLVNGELHERVVLGALKIGTAAMLSVWSDLAQDQKEN